MPRELLAALLGYVDRPWKAGAIALLVIVGVLCFIIFEQRQQITQAVLQGYCPACTPPPASDAKP